MKKQTIVIEIENDGSRVFFQHNWIAKADNKLMAEGAYYKTHRQAVAAATRFLADIHNFNYQFKTK